MYRPKMPCSFGGSSLDPSLRSGDRKTLPIRSRDGRTLRHMISSGGTEPLVIAQISGLHCAGAYCLPTLLQRAVTAGSDPDPHVVVVSVDIPPDAVQE